MKKLFILLIGLAAGGFVAGIVISNISRERFARELAHKEAVWETEKASLKMALHDARNRSPGVRTIVQQSEIETAKEESPEQIIEKLRTLRVGASNPKAVRAVIHQLENLMESKTEALPAVREFLSRNEDVDYDTTFSSWRGARDGKAQTDFIFPPSLRFGLLDVVRQIGGVEAEKLLADTLSETGRGAEIGYLARVLEEIAPNKYRELALSAAHDLLKNSSLVQSSGGVDKYDREYLYGVLAFYRDASFAGEAQNQLVRADGVIDRGALKYLQLTVGAQAVSAMAQAYENSTIEPTKKEPLVRYALNFAGVDAQATEFWRKGINDPNLTVDQRRELIEDLNQDGIESEKKPTARDAEIAARRLELIARFRNETNNPILQAAWNEAEKDLRNMLANFAKNSTQ